jgi:hypothetical protein
MTKFIVSEDWGNSAKNAFVQKITIAFAKGDSKFILSNVTDDIRWNMIGDQPIQGKDHFVETPQSMKRDTVEVLTIRHVATHGKAGPVGGMLRLENDRLRAYGNFLITYVNTSLRKHR